MGNDYLFFDDGLQRRFIECAATYGITCRVRPDRMEGTLVELGDDVPEAIAEALEQQYDALLDEQRQLTDASDHADATDVMGVTVSLPDGQTCLVRLPVEYGRRLVEHFTFEEIHALVCAIAHSVAHPVDGPLCQPH